MSKFVIAGSSDCPYLAKLELLADKLSTSLPKFQVHKIILPKERWTSWLSEKCSTNNWKHHSSPIVWQELVDRGGKGKLLGGFNEFMEYTQCYFGLTSDMMTDLMYNIRDENEITCTKKIEQEKYLKSLSRPMQVCIVNALNPVAYHLIPEFCSGKIFGKEIEISLRLVHVNSDISALSGIQMEVQDLAYPLVRQITISNNVKEAFDEVMFVVFLDDTLAPNKNENEDQTLITNFNQYKYYAECLNKNASPDAKVVLSGNGPVNFNAYCLIKHATSLKEHNIVVSSRLQERRAQTLLAEKLNVISADIEHLIILGNCGNNSPFDSIHPDLSLASVKGYDGAITGPIWFSRSLIEIVYDNKWLSDDFISSHNDRENALKLKLNHATSMSEAAALSTLVIDWIQGTSNNKVFSLGVKCQGWNGITDCVFSLPVKFVGGTYIVVDYLLETESQAKLLAMENIMKKDLRIAFPEMDDTVQEVFGRDSELVTTIISPKDAPSKTSGDKLEIIREEDAEDQLDLVQSNELSRS